MDERSKPENNANGKNGDKDKKEEQTDGTDDMDFGDDIVGNDNDGKIAATFDELEEQNKQLIEELEKKKSELDQLSDKMKRAQADFEN